MKRLLAFVLFLPLGALGQTAITATISDSDSIAWANGTWAATLVSPSGPPQGCTTATTVSGTMSGSGVITGSLCDNSLVGPSGSTWRFTLCPNASATCSQVSTAVSGATQNISSVLSAGVTAPRFAASFGAHGYADVEVLPSPPLGATYYNVTTPAFRQWTAGGWASIGGGGGGGCTAIGTVGVVQAASGTAGACEATPLVFDGTNLTSGNANIISNNNIGAIAGKLQLYANGGFSVITFNGDLTGIGSLVNEYIAAGGSGDPAMYFDTLATGNFNFRTPVAGVITNSLSITPTAVVTSAGVLPSIDPAITVGQSVCVKAAGPPLVIGKCTSVVGAGGACTCT